MKQVVVILKEIDYGDSITTSVHGVYESLSDFYTEAKSKKLNYDSRNHFYYKNEVSYRESVHDIKGTQE